MSILPGQTLTGWLIQCLYLTLKKFISLEIQIKINSLYPIHPSEFTFVFPNIPGWGNSDWVANPVVYLTLGKIRVLEQEIDQ